MARSTNLITLGGLALGCAFAGTSAGQISDPYVVIEVATSSGRTGSLTISKNDPFVANGTDGGLVYAGFFPQVITDQFGDPIATVRSIFAPSTAENVETVGVIDAKAAIVTELVAGDEDTTFTITSAFVETTQPIANAIVQGDGLYTVGDEGGGGVTVTGPNGPGALNEFFVNGTVDTGTLVGSLNNLTGPFNTNNLTDSFADTLPDTALGFTVNSFQFRSTFTLSANDQATSNFDFNVVPAPASVGLLALGGMVAARRRR
ncbi:MAG: VPLPA-CTERM sorting domain-containing protein [Planctomycetota bacterium]